MMKKILVCGGRDYADQQHVNASLLMFKPCVIIQGGARGADKLAETWANESQLPCVRHPAEWTTYGKSAGPIRNQAMLDMWQPDIVLAFPGGRGTADMVERAGKQGFDVHCLRREDTSED